MHGKGVFKHNNGWEYKGDFQESQFTGKGKWTNSKGDTYSGK